MGLPQLIVIAIYSIGLGIAMAQHGKPKEGKENALVSFIATTIMMALLYWGGFFTK